jgi:hypothetical protein
VYRATLVRAIRFFVWRYTVGYRETRLSLEGNRLDIDLTRLNIEVIKPNVSP